MSDREKNAFEELLKNLKKQKLNHNTIQIAYRSWVREREDLPEGIRDILGGRKSDPGLLFQLFQDMANVIGSIELAYHRGYSAGYEDCKSQKTEGD